MTRVLNNLEQPQLRHRTSWLGLKLVGPQGSPEAFFNANHLAELSAPRPSPTAFALTRSGAVGPCAVTPA